MAEVARMYLGMSASEHAPCINFLQEFVGGHVFSMRQEALS